MVCDCKLCGGLMVRAPDEVFCAVLVDDDGGRVEIPTEHISHTLPLCFEWVGPYRNDCLGNPWRVPQTEREIRAVAEADHGLVGHLTV